MQSNAKSRSVIRLSKHTFKCKYCGIELDEFTFETHAYHCETQPLVECGACGRKIKSLLFELYGCNHCNYEIYKHSRKQASPYCPYCSGQNVELVDGDEDWDNMQCKDCRKYYKVTSLYADEEAITGA